MDDQTSTQPIHLFGPSVIAEGQPQAEMTVLQITLADDGRITFRGPRVALAELLVVCARHGFVIDLDYLNWCG